MICGLGCGKGKLNFCWIHIGNKSPKLLKRKVFIYLEDQLQDFPFIFYIFQQKIYFSKHPLLAQVESSVWRPRAWQRGQAYDVQVGELLP